ncbi:MAG TPA: 1-acyl-sn-glycerol-3-phosphate acyltransferase [bacterium]|nr:1-acyl-sn-glycerol-3-phosphate acyltransferase [bacterium]
MANQNKKEEGKVVHLKPVPPAEKATPAFEDLIEKLEGRIDRIEKEFRETVHKIEKRDTGKPPLSQNDLSSLIGRLEERIQIVSDEIRSGRLFSDGRKTVAFTEILQRIAKLLSFDAYRDFLKELWFGRPEENYDVDEFGMDPTFIQKVKPLFDFLYYNYWRVSVEGLLHIPNEGRGLIVANHSGTLPYDGSMIGAAVVNEHPSRKDVRFLVEDFVYHFPFLGTFMYRIGGVRACPENAERLLAKDHLVTVFPEGIKGIGKHYKNRYRLQRFGRGGFIKLALRTNSPVIPTAVIGAEEIHPLIYKSTILARPLGIPYIPVTPTLPLLGPLGLIPLPSKWTVVFGEPIVFGPKYGPKDADDQLLVNRLSEMVRMKIQDMVTETLKKRRSIWFG